MHPLVPSAPADDADARRVARRRSRFSSTRDRVVAAVENELVNQLVVLRAPRGAGKTEALAQLASAVRARGSRRVATASLAAASPTTGRPDDLWAGLLSAFTPANPGQTTADAPGRDLDRLVAAIGDAPALVVLDDVSSETADALVDELLTLLDSCAGLTVIAAGRERTRLETPRVSVRCDTAVVDPDVLLLTTAETVDVLSLAGVAADPEPADVLRRTLGCWPAALRLAAAHLRFRGESTLTVAGVDRLAFTVLEENAGEVLGALEPELSEFAREASLTPYLTPELVSEVLARAGSATDGGLARLERAGIGGWTTVDGESRFVLVPVLRAPLSAHAEVADPASALRIRRAVAEHVGRHGDPLLAAELAADAGDWPLVVSFLEGRFADCWRSDAGRLDALGARIPTSVVDDASSLGVSMLTAAADRAYTPLVHAQLTRLLGSIRPARPTHDGDPVAIGPETRRLLLRRRTGEFGAAAGAADRLAEMVDHLAARDSSPSDRRAEALLQIGLGYLHAGRPKDGRWRLTEAARSTVAPHLRVSVIGTLALMDVLDGNVRDAATWLASLRAEERASWSSSPWGVAAELARAAVAFEEARVDDASALLDGVEREHPTTEWWPVLAALRATEHLLGGDAFTGMNVVRGLEEVNAATPSSRPIHAHLDAARSDLLVALRQSRRAVGSLRSPSGVHDTMAGALARALLFAGQDHHAYVVAQQWSVREQTTPRTTIEALLVHAAADVRLGRSGAARDTVARALALTTATGSRLPWSMIPADDHERIVALLPVDARSVVRSLPLQFRENLTIPVLSAREQIVLAKLQSGAPIAQIARSLVVSPNTVKTQVRSVYRKLGASTRREAIRSAHEWGILRGDGPAGEALTGT